MAELTNKSLYHPRLKMLLTRLTFYSQCNNKDVGGISKKCTENDMRDFLSQSQVRVTFLRFFCKEQRRTASAQMNILAEDDEKILQESFWPDGVFIKAWLPWSAFIDSKQY